MENLNEHYVSQMIKGNIKSCNIKYLWYNKEYIWYASWLLPQSS